MMLNPHISLSFNGECEAAFRFYERCLGGKIISIFTWGKSPMAGEAPPGWAEKVMYASLTIDETLISGSDVPPALEVSRRTPERSARQCPNCVRGRPSRELPVPVGAEYSVNRVREWLL